MTLTPNGFIDPTKPLIWTVEDLLTPDECVAAIASVEALGFAEAPINTPFGAVRRASTRNNTRVVFDDHTQAARIFDRVRSRVPSSLHGWFVSGLNERFRGYRYEPGQYFKPHRDGAFVRNSEETSLVTLIVYLNDNFEGGETAFLDTNEVVRPKAGLALLFQHPLVHEGCTVTAGHKYVLRTDVMYRCPDTAP